MNDEVIKQINEAEERLAKAMLGSDVAGLDELLSEKLIFTDHLGRLLTKGDDLESHRRGVIKLDELAGSEQTIKLAGDCAIVFVRMHIAGSFFGQPGSGDFRFTRVWSRNDEGEWQVVAGHSVLIAQEKEDREADLES
jgi:ketosteroid isomerase-like protein